MPGVYILISLCHCIAVTLVDNVQIWEGKAIHIHELRENTYMFVVYVMIISVRGHQTHSLQVHTVGLRLGV